MRKTLGLAGFIAVAIVALISSGYAQNRSGEVAGSAKNERSKRATSIPDAGVITDDDLLKPPPADEMLQEIESLEVQCLNEVNRLRQSRKLVPLTFSEDLLQVARSYSRRMAEEKFFSHNDPEGRSVRERVNDANIKWRMVGENLALSNGYINPVAVSLHGWMDSPGHRRNILDPDWRHTAIGVWIGSTGTIYFTEIFLTQ
ncbi:MAG: CAP domain-containing protein [Blastocatellia bacterium]